MGELERRINMVRSDHSVFSKDQIQFMKDRHVKRLEESMKLGIPILNVSKSPKQILIDLYKQSS